MIKKLTLIYFIIKIQKYKRIQVIKALMIKLLISKKMEKKTRFEISLSFFLGVFLFFCVFWFFRFFRFFRFVVFFRKFHIGNWPIYISIFGPCYFSFFLQKMSIRENRLGKFKNQKKRKHAKMLGFGAVFYFLVLMFFSSILRPTKKWKKKHKIWNFSKFLFFCVFFVFLCFFDFFRFFRFFRILCYFVLETDQFT